MSRIVEQDVSASKALPEEEDQQPPTHGQAGVCTWCAQVLHKAWDFAAEHWFILGVGLAIGIAAAVPNFGRTHGWIRAEYTIKYGAVIIIFLLSGMSLKSRVLAQALARAHLHLLIQVLCLGLTPLIGYGVVSALRTAGPWLNKDLVSGLVVCTSMPTTVSTNVVFTKQAGGNEAVALINAVIGNVIGIFISPGLLTLYAGQSGQAPYSDVLQQLGITVIAPLVAGQIAQYLLPRVVQWLQSHVNFGKVSNSMILLLVWNTFSNTFHNKVKANAGSLVLIIALCVLLFMVFSAVCFTIATAPPIRALFRITRSDAVAVVMCGGTKTLALGMPLITVLYGGAGNAGLLALPLIVYHASQILQGNVAIAPLKRWVEAEDPGLHSSKAAAAGKSADGDNDDIEQPAAAGAPHIMSLDAKAAASLPCSGSTSSSSSATDSPPAADEVPKQGSKDADAATGRR